MPIDALGFVVLVRVVWGASLAGSGVGFINTKWLWFYIAMVGVFFAPCDCVRAGLGYVWDVLGMRVGCFWGWGVQSKIASILYRDVADGFLVRFGCLWAGLLGVFVGLWRLWAVSGVSLVFRDFMVGCLFQELWALFPGSP